jgi:hypothetical protein
MSEAGVDGDRQKRELGFVSKWLSAFSNVRRQYSVTQSAHIPK